MVKVVKKSSVQVSIDSSVADFKNSEKIGKRDAENVIEKPIAKKQKIEQKEQSSIKRLAALTKTKFEAPPAPKEKSTSASSDHSCFAEEASQLPDVQTMCPVNLKEKEESITTETDDDFEEDMSEEKPSDLAKYTESVVRTKEFISQNSPEVDASGSEKSGSDKTSSEESESDKSSNLAKYTESTVQTKEYISQNTPVMEASVSESSEESGSEESGSEESDSEGEDKPSNLAKYTKSIVPTKEYISQNTHVVEASGSESSEESGSEESESEDKPSNLAKYTESNVQTKEYISQNTPVVEASGSESSEESGSEESESENEDKLRNLAKYTESSVQTKEYTSQNTPVVEASGSDDEDATNPKDMKMENGENSDKFIDGSKKLENGHGDDDCEVEWKTPQKDKDLVMNGVTSKNKELYKRILESKTLYCENISRDIDVDALYDFFKEAGEVIDVRIYKLHYGHSACVKFATAAEVTKALELDGQELKGCRLRLKRYKNKKEIKAQRAMVFSTTLFCANISSLVNIDSVPDAMCNFFKEAGRVVDVRLARHLNGALKGFGHVVFATTEEAKKALKLNGRELLGHQLRIEPAEWNDSNSFQNGDQSKAQKGATAFMDNDSFQNGGQSKVQNGVTAFIKGFNMEWDADKIEANLFNFFESCGEITHITLLRGGALMDFKDSGSLNNALLLNGLSFYGNPLIVDRLEPHDNNHSGGRGFGNRGRGGRGFGNRGRGGRGFGRRDSGGRGFGRRGGGGRGRRI